MTIMTAIAWQSETKTLLSPLSIEGTARQFWKKN